MKTLDSGAGDIIIQEVVNAPAPGFVSPAYLITVGRMGSG